MLIIIYLLYEMLIMIVQSVNEDHKYSLFIINKQGAIRFFGFYYQSDQLMKGIHGVSKINIFMQSYMLIVLTELTVLIKLTLHLMLIF